MNAPADAPLCGMDIRSADRVASTCSVCSSAESCSNSTLESRSTVVGFISSPFVCAFCKDFVAHRPLSESIDEVDDGWDSPPAVADGQRVAAAVGHLLNLVAAADG